MPWIRTDATDDPLSLHPNPEIPKLMLLQMKRAAGYKPAYTWSGIANPGPSVVMIAVIINTTTDITESWQLESFT